MENSIKIDNEYEDPNRFFWYFIYASITIVTALPLLGLRISDFGINYLFLLVVHEMAAFLFFGHTLFSNIWVTYILEKEQRIVFYCKLDLSLRRRRE